jgi:hypothetical protein
LRFLSGQIETIIVLAGNANVETFTEPKELLENPHYQDQRQRILTDLNDDMIDTPIIDLINRLNQLPYCFTLQCCYGHFIHSNQKDPYNLEPLPITDSIAKVEYRIAYIALCIENSVLGKGFLEALSEITAIDPKNIQLCCAEWFWRRQVNSYALQVQPNRFKHEDTAILDYKEALHIEKTRNEFFVNIRELIQKQHRRDEFL